MAKQTENGYDYDPTANPVGNLPLFPDEKKPIEKIEAEKTKTDDEKPQATATPLPHMDRPRKSLAQMAAEAQKESTEGKLVCPHCGCVDFRVTNTSVVNGFRKRLRRCRHCGYPVNTIEFVMRE